MVDIDLSGRRRVPPMWLPLVFAIRMARAPLLTHVARSMTGSLSALSVWNASLAWWRASRRTKLWALRLIGGDGDGDGNGDRDCDGDGHGDDDDDDDDCQNEVC